MKHRRSVLNKTDSSFGSCQTAEKDWICSTGECVYSSIFCGSISACFSQGVGSKICAEGYCVQSESNCMRPCGFNMTIHKKDGKSDYYSYNRKCDDFPGKCLRDISGAALFGVDSNCPKKCAPGKKYCGPDLCVDYCPRCYDYRCPNTGECYSYSDKCDGVNDCSDGYDELNCPTDPPPVPAMDHYTGIICISVGVGAFVLVVAVCLFNSRYQLRGRREAATSSGRTVDGGGSSDYTEDNMVGLKIFGVVLLVCICIVVVCVKKARKSVGRATNATTTTSSGNVIVSGTRPAAPTTVAMEALSRPGYPSGSGPALPDPYAAPPYPADSAPYSADSSYPGANAPFLPPGGASPYPASSAPYPPLVEQGSAPPYPAPPTDSSTDPPPPSYSEVMHIRPPEPAPNYGGNSTA